MATPKVEAKKTGKADVAALSARALIEALEQYGFDALYINRKGYNDNAGNLIEKSSRLGKFVISESSELIGFKLAPSENPALPQPKLLVVWKRFLR